MKSVSGSGSACARRADNICEANAAVGVRLRSAIAEALGTLVAITADKTRKAAA
jgi:hypothetical protein